MTIQYHGIIRTDTTDDNGRYTFTMVPLCYCLKTVTASKQGYESQSVDVGVSKLTTVNFQLVPDNGEIPVGTVSGTVTDAETGDPVEDALVVISYHETVRTTYTAADGTYSFDEVPECRCLKKVEASKDGYEPQSKDVSVHGDTVVDFALEVEEQEPPVEGGTVSGVVTDADTGEPIEDAMVVLTHDGKVWRTWTDAEGWYELTGIPLCFCLKDMTVSKEGYQTQQVSVAIGEDTIVDFALQPKEDTGIERPDVAPGPRIAIAFPGIDTIPGRINESPVAEPGFVGASIAVLATGLYAYVVKM